MRKVSSTHSLSLRCWRFFLKAFLTRSSRNAARSMLSELLRGGGGGTSSMVVTEATPNPGVGAPAVVAVGADGWAVGKNAVAPLPLLLPRTQAPSEFTVRLLFRRGSGVRKLWALKREGTNGRVCTKQTNNPFFFFCFFAN